MRVSMKFSYHCIEAERVAVVDNVYIPVMYFVIVADRQHIRFIGSTGSQWTDQKHTILNRNYT